jgi:hypothetical protein
VWYDVSSKELKGHSEEIAQFCQIIRSEVAFRTLTYQELS